jgi:hypothetical protein
VVDRVGAVIRLLAALVAPVVIVLALLTWVPDDVTGSGLLAIANTGDEPVARPARPVGAGHPDDLEAMRRMLADRAGVSSSRSNTTQRVVVPAAEDPSFAVTIDMMTPSVVPSSGPVVLRGRVTNTTDETWTGLNVHPFLSPSPMRTSAEVELAAASDPAIFIDSRIVTPGAFDESIDELAPGATARWLVRLPQAVLQEEIDGTEGVYWIGVHVLGANSEGRDDLADGRARSFIPLIGRDAPAVPTSPVVPLRRSTLHDGDGRVAGEDEWTGELAAGGRLENLLSLVERARDARITLLVDPAVLDAVGQLAEGNPARDLAPTPKPGGDEPPATDEEPAEPDAAQLRAAAWLDRFVAVADDHRVLALPYADLDLAAAARNSPGIYTRARKQSEDALDGLGIAATPAIAPPSGLINDEALSLFDDGETVLLSSEALPARYADAENPPTNVTTDDRRVSVYDAAVARGGPGPNPRLDPVSLRQRVLAEAAVRAIRDDARPLVVNLPSDFDPGAADRGFFAGLDRPFVRLGTTLDDATADTPEVGDLVYPARQLERELDPGNFAATADLIDGGETLDRLLPANDTIGQQVVREALATTSYMLRDDPLSATSAAYAAAAWIDARLAKVQLSAPSFVILSADSGPFAVTVTNELDQPVRLKIAARTRDDLVIKAPETIELEAGKQQSVTLTAQTDSIGVHPLRLIATDESGRPLGASEEISVRSNKVGRIIWVIMGAGVGILFLAIGVRLVRRVRGACAT